MKQKKIGIRICAMCTQNKSKKPTDKKRFRSWAYGFSATVLKAIFALWAVSIVFCMFVITYTIINGGSMEEPVNFMHEINSTFGASVVGVLVTRVVGNVFEHNNGGIFGQSIREGNENDNTDSVVYAGDMRSNDELDRGSGQEDVYG